MAAEALTSISGDYKVYVAVIMITSGNLYINWLHLDTKLYHLSLNNPMLGQLISFSNVIAWCYTTNNLGGPDKVWAQTSRDELLKSMKYPVLDVHGYPTIHRPQITLI